MRAFRLLITAVFLIFLTSPAFAVQQHSTEKVRVLFSSNLLGQTTSCG